MQKVVEEFAKKTSIKPQFIITLSDASYLKKYNKIWDSEKDKVKATINLLEDYTKASFSHLARTGLWHKQASEQVKKAIYTFKQNPSITVPEILQYFTNHAENFSVSAEDSLAKRLRYIAGQTHTEFSFIPNQKQTETIVNPSYRAKKA